MIYVVIPFEKILHSKKALRLILDADHIKSSSVPIVSTSIEKVDEIFEWGDYGIPVVAEFSTMENRILFEKSCKKGRCNPWDLV